MEEISIEQQVAALTFEQKKNIRKYELISGCIALIIVVPILISFFMSLFEYKKVNDEYNSAYKEYFSSSVWDRIGDDGFDKVEEKEEAKDKAYSEFLRTAVICVVCLVAYFGVVMVVYHTVIKKKMPYYSMKKASYLLTHKIK